MERNPSLRDLQLTLRRLIAAPGTEAELAPASLPEWLPVRGDQRLGPMERIAIYADMYFVRIRDAIREDYPALHAALGDEGFSRLVRGYLILHPTEHPSLRYAGRNLPRFLAASPRVEGAAWLEDLARFEWTLVEAFEVADQAVLARNDLQSLPPSAWTDLGLRAVRSLAVLELDFEVDAARDRANHGEPIGSVRRTPIVTRIWRQGFSVFHRRMDAVEAAAVKQIAGGVRFGDLCECIAEVLPEGDAATRAVELLELWLADELLARESTPDEPLAREELSRDS